MPWWKQGTGYSEKGRKDRRLSMSERVWPVACRECRSGPPSCNSAIAATSEEMLGAVHSGVFERDEH